jgi:branched-chain amino acid aminotransferase
MNSYPHTFFKTKIIKTENANINIMTNALQYGTGVFAGIRGYYNKKNNSITIFRIKDHYTRFLNSHQILNVNCKYNVDQLIQHTINLTKQNNPQSDTYYRPFSYAGQLQISPNLATTPDFDFALYMIPLGDYLATDRGIKTCISSWIRNPDNCIPSKAKISGGYINSALAKQEAIQNGFEEAIMLNTTGNVSEGSAMNLFIVKNNTLITSPLSDDILEGITRKTIIQLAKDIKIPTQEQSITRSQLYTADELFFVGTGAQVSPIASIDNRPINQREIGTITKQLQKAYFKTVKGDNPKYSHWCTTIKLS